MLIEAYSASVFPAWWRLFGFKIWRVTLGQMLLLHRVGNPFADVGAPDFDLAKCTLEQCVEACYYLSRHHERGYRASLNPVWIECRLWLGRLRAGKTWEQKRAYLFSRLLDEWDRPELTDFKSGDHEGAPLLFCLIAHHTLHGKTLSDALEMPLSVSAWEMVRCIEWETTARIKTEADYEAEIERLELGAKITNEMRTPEFVEKIKRDGFKIKFPNDASIN